MTSFFDDEKQVVPLITCENGEYNVCEETLLWLESVGEFGVIACAGKYRTGKSFLLNRLAQAESNCGFGVGDTVQACTKGLWLYKKVFETKDNKKFVFIDTEGIDALDANDTHDVRIFTLALLLSSSFIYNSVGPIDETALQTLSLMTRVTQNVKFDADDTVKDLSPHMPRFYWVLRDFSLKLMNKKNEEITEDQYLSDALQGTSDPNKNSVRDAIRNSFMHRNLVTFPRPSTTIDPNAQRMEDRLMSLSRPFTNAVDNFRKRLFSETNHMQAQDKIITGKMYVVLCRHFAKIVQTNSVPVIKDSWSLLSSVHAKDLKDKLLKELQHTLATMKAKPRDQLTEEMQNVRRTLIDRFVKESMKPTDTDVKCDFESQMEDCIVEARRRLELNIAEKVEKSLESLEASIEANPEQLSVILNTELERFTSEFNDSDFTKAWMVTASERALCRWIPRSLQTLSQRSEQSEYKLERMTEEYRIDIMNKTTEKEEAIREEKIKRSELEQLYESCQNAIYKESQETLRLQHEILCMSLELRNIDVVPTRTFIEGVERTGDDETMRLEDELSTARIEYAELTAKFALQKTSYDKIQREKNDAVEKLERAMLLQAQLEQNLRDGIEKLKKEQIAMSDKQKADFETRMQLMTNDMSKLKTQCDAYENDVRDLTILKEKLEDKLVQQANNHEQCQKQLTESANRYRQQSDESQNRVLEIHKNMLDDLRIRDERAREQQSKYLRETSEHNQKMSDCQREADLCKSENKTLKRRVLELEGMETEHKRLKTNDKEKDILVAQLTAENGELRSSNADMLQERELLRKENMQMEGELSILRAEKQFNEVRRSMS